MSLAVACYPPDWACEVVSSSTASTDRALTCADFARVHAEPFEALELDLSLLWEEEPPSGSPD